MIYFLHTFNVSRICSHSALNAHDCQTCMRVSVSYVRTWETHGNMNTTFKWTKLLMFWSKADLSLKSWRVLGDEITHFCGKSEVKTGTNSENVPFSKAKNHFNRLQHVTSVWVGSVERVHKSGLNDSWSPYECSSRVPEVKKKSHSFSP